MTGKQKCELLKEIRKNMAKENGIPYEPRECHHEGYCTGTCPLCEKEATELLLELKLKFSFIFLTLLNFHLDISGHSITVQL